MLRKLAAAGVLTLALAVAPAVGASATTVPEPPVAPAPTAPLETPVPAPAPAIILDEGHFFSTAETAKLTADLGGVTSKFGILPVVEVVNTIGTETAEHFANRRFNELGVGDATVNNGLYILISEQEHALQVQPGLGVKDKVPQARIQTIVNSTMLPLFKQGNFVGGVVAGATEVGKTYSGVTPAQSGVIPPIRGYENGPSSSPAVFDGGTFLTTLLGLFGSLILIAGGVALFGFVRAARKRKREAAEVTRQQTLAAYVEKQVAALKDDSSFYALPEEAARYAYLQKRFILPEAHPEEKPALLNNVLTAVQVAAVAESMGGVPAQFFISVKPEESIEQARTRIATDVPEARERQQEAERQAEEKRRRDAEAAAVRRKQEEEERQRRQAAESDWSRLSRSDQQRIARASSESERNMLLQQYMPGFNSAYLPLYMVMAGSMLSTMQAEEARAAEQARAEQARQDSYTAPAPSFPSFDAGGSFGGGSSDGGGAGGTW